MARKEACDVRGVFGGSHTSCSGQQEGFEFVQAGQCHHGTDEKGCCPVLRKYRAVGALRHSVAGAAQYELLNGGEGVH